NMEDKSKKTVQEALDKVMHGAELPYHAVTNEIHRTWGCQWWEEQLALPSTAPSLSFPMLNRLAAYLLRSNPKITAVLRATYSHVFLDEFQDTTPSQWDLIMAAFVNSNSVLTAVGDGKQRIMVWAGADAEIFDKFKVAFQAEPVTLIRNYRSVPELVRIQHAIAQIVETDSAEPEAATGNLGDGVCSIFGFDSPQSEAIFLANRIHREIEEGARPRDFCVLARQSVGDMVALLQAELRARGISLRDESLLQDLRVEPLSNIVMLTLRLATAVRDPMAWSDLTSELGILTGLDEEIDSAELERLTLSHKNWAKEFLDSGADIKNFPSGIVTIVGAARYRTCYRQYMNGSYLEKVATELGSALANSLESAGTVEDLVRDFVGEDVVPAMSIHKSKGLEFKTVIFMGLEDEQWWNFRAQPEEEKRAFFVAFSRAINTVLFTFSKERPKWGRPTQTNRAQVGALFNILQRAGIEVTDIGHV
ncbi:3'-5' exonuclease, partial [Collimonas silvisoli]|uniref:3'-5' exonuclease n=1 Tax=Collimonas silvisoli TaxID=2825884 RepID=UPI001B8BB784